MPGTAHHSGGHNRLGPRTVASLATSADLQFDYLPPKASAWAQSIWSELSRLGVVAPVDESAMAEAANTKMWLDQIDAMLAEDMGVDERLALLRQRNQYSQSFMRWCARFGLTPSDRIVAQASSLAETADETVPMPDIGDLE